MNPENGRGDLQRLLAQAQADVFNGGLALQCIERSTDLSNLYLEVQRIANDLQRALAVYRDGKPEKL